MLPLKGFGLKDLWEPGTLGIRVSGLRRGSGAFLEFRGSGVTGGTCSTARVLGALSRVLQLVAHRAAVATKHVLARSHDGAVTDDRSKSTAGMPLFSANGAQ